MTIAYIIGNGPSRSEIDLRELKGKGTIYGCNALYRDYPQFDIPDYLVAIDDIIIDEIDNSLFPSDRFIKPPEEDRFEDNKYNPLVRNRSNAGMNAMTEAVKAGHDKIYCFGFDFMLKTADRSLGNIYEGSPGYGRETRSRYIDNINRVNYMTYVAKKHPSANFVFVVPEYGNMDEYHTVEASNVTGTFYGTFLRQLREGSIV